MKKLIVLAVGVLFLVSGCASKSKFVYECPTGGLENGKGMMVAAVVRIVDQRKDAANFDIVYDGDAVKDIQSMFEYELLRTGLFKQIVSVTDTTKIKADVIFEPTLNKLQWQVPDYDSIHLKKFLFGFVTGVIGGTLYGLTGTDVYGESGMNLRVTDVASGKVVLNKSYSGQYKQGIVKFKCDRPETKVMVAEKSVRDAMESIKSDITQVLGNKGKEVASGEALTPVSLQQQSFLKGVLNDNPLITN